jgi:hypothetical protein
VINMSVRKYYAADWSAYALGRFAYVGRRSGNVGINESEAVIFPDEKTIDHTETSQTEEILCFLNKVHTIPSETQ